MSSIINSATGHLQSSIGRITHNPRTLAKGEERINRAHRTRGVRTTRHTGVRTAPRTGRHTGRHTTRARHHNSAAARGGIFSSLKRSLTLRRLSAAHQPQPAPRAGRTGLFGRRTPHGRHARVMNSHHAGHRHSKVRQGRRHGLI